jgi:hypothetical protein
MLAQNAAIERLLQKDARTSCSKNKKMRDSNTEHTETFSFRVFRVFRGEENIQHLSGREPQWKTSTNPT